jgi:hypothetical protein
MAEDIADDEILDTEWIDNFKENEYAYNKFYKEPNTAIMLYFLYVNKSKELIYTDTNRCLLDDMGVLNKDRIIALIKHYQMREQVKYKLNSLLRYNIDLNPDEITDFVNTTTPSQFLTPEKYLDDIHYKDSIYMFQNLNALYFIYTEELTQLSSTMSHTKRISLSTKKHKTLRNKHIKISKEIR